MCVYYLKLIHSIMTFYMFYKTVKTFVMNSETFDYLYEADTNDLVYINAKHESSLMINLIHIIILQSLIKIP
jgi:hypothetical protein